MAGRQGQAGAASRILAAMKRFIIATARRPSRNNPTMTARWFCAAALCALSLSSAQAQTTASSADLASPKFGKWGMDLAGRDTRAKPGDDFFRFANGAFLDKLAIPADRNRFGNFDALNELSQRRVRAILEDEAKRAPANPTDEAGKVGAFYKSFMDEARIEQLGAEPLKPELANIAKVQTRDELAALMGRGATTFIRPLFGMYIDADQKAPDRYAVYIGQDGLGLPDRDYYLKPEFAEKKAAYEKYIAQMLTLGGWPNPEANAKAILAFETRIAEASWTKVEQRDADKTYNPMTVADLAKSAPGFAWRAFLDNAELDKVDRVVVGEVTALPKIAAIYNETPIDTLRAWSAFGVIDSSAPYLADRFVQARFEFRSKTLSGTPQLAERWKRGVGAAQSGLGEAIGRVYVARYFTPEAKAKMDALVGELKVAMKARIERLDWMSGETKAKALDKLSKFGVKIGYPTKWRDYSSLKVDPTDLYGNMERSIAFSWRRDVQRLDKPVDRTEWIMTPQTVNAYYNPVMNEIVFPAAILQPPFFDPDADPAVNYGGIGGVIGHEMTHGFDDQGRKYDGDGRLISWWTDSDAGKFETAAKGLGGQYSSFEPLPGAKVNGDLTMGENIADLGGLLLALDAYKLSLKGKPAPVIDGLTGEQRVFYGWAQVWREKARDDARRQQLVTDPHSPSMYRVNGVVRNIDAWYSAFGVKPGDKLYVPPEQRVRIW
jgi:putative endopeptidase